MTTRATAIREARELANETGETVWVVYSPDGWALPRHSYFPVNRATKDDFYPNSEIIAMFEPEDRGG